jgi:hypothetical protein
MHRLPLFILVLLLGCDGIREGAANAFRAPAAPTPVVADVICDFGGGSSGCTSESLTALLRDVTPTLPAGSLVRLHGMADAVADGRQLSEFTITKPKKRTVKAVAGHRRRQTDAIVQQFVAAAQPLFANAERRASPIAETIARALLAGSSDGAQRHLFLLTDAREVSRNPSLGRIDAECGPIPNPADFAQRLRRLYPPDSLRGVRVHFVHVQLEPVANHRCSATVERYTQLKTTWTCALQAQGATVTWSMN